MNEVIVDAMMDIKGYDITILDLRKLDDRSTNFFIICHGTSNTQVGSIADNIQKKVKEKLAINASHVEGGGNSQWVLLDYFDTVVHVFHQNARSFYRLEELWNDASVTTFD